MPVRYFECPECGAMTRTLKRVKPTCVHAETAKSYPMEEVLVAPELKFQEYKDHVAKEKGKAQLKDQDRILRERTRSHSREHEMHDLVQSNDREEAVRNQWINEDGSVRKKIDDK